MRWSRLTDMVPKQTVDERDSVSHVGLDVTLVRRSVALL
jgi:hypothetical protein